MMFSQQDFPIVTTSSLFTIGRSHTLRCDAKQTENRFSQFRKVVDKVDCFFLGQYLPNTLMKGSQPSYLDSQEGIPVINTLSIQQLQINQNSCRYISEDDFETISDDKKLKPFDVLLTMDGGTSIGKTVLFNLDGDWTVDSHVAILRPEGIKPKSLVYLLASPLGQIQFHLAESGASGQTAVTEEDLRRFIFPVNALAVLEDLTDNLDSKRTAIRTKIEELQKEEIAAWAEFAFALVGKNS